jgi:hypothetical protein
VEGWMAVCDLCRLQVNFFRRSGELTVQQSGAETRAPAPDRFVPPGTE